jgi:hypothetical protein
VQAKLGVRLPSAYVALLRRFNGGYPRKAAYLVRGDASGEDDWVMEVESIYGLKEIAWGGSLACLDEPPDGLVEFGTRDGGHDLLCFDYRACGPQGEPAVVTMEDMYPDDMSQVSPNFETLVNGMFSAEKADCFGFRIAEDDQQELWETIRDSLSLTQLGDSCGQHATWKTAPWSVGTDPTDFFLARSAANGQGFRYFPEHPECTTVLHASIHPKHRPDLGRVLSQLPHPSVVVHKVIWSHWRSALDERLDEYDKE